MRSGARLFVQRAERVPSLGCTMGCLRARLSRAAWVENGFVGYVARGHGRCVFAKRLTLRSRSLPLHGTIFHPWRSYFPGLWPRPSAAWTIRLELDWPRNNHRSNRLHLGSRIVSRSISTGRIQRGLTQRCSQRLAWRFSRIIALPEYFRSDTRGLARSFDMYPNRLSR